MKAAGIVVEYNPFHNGHLFHALESRRVTECDVLIAVMSGPFLQRGEPALLSKWKRAEMALHSHVDIIIELPYVFAAQHATHFASGAVQLLNAIGCDSICFGSEDGTVDAFLRTIDFRKQNQSLLDNQIITYLQEGYSYPAAVSKSYEFVSEDSASVLDLSQPNNMLGLQYIEAIQQHAGTIKPYTIKRQSSGYHDPALHNEKISSATSIRKSLFETDHHQIREHVPAISYQLMSDYVKQYGQFHQWEDYWAILQYKLLTHLPSELRSIYEIEEGVEYRLIEAAKTSTSFIEFMQNVKTRRYTWTRIQRMLTHILTHTKKEEIADHLSPGYLRLLGMTDTGRLYLNQHKKDLSLPLISRVGRDSEKNLSLDLRASMVYASGINNQQVRKELLLSDYKNPPVMVSK